MFALSELGARFHAWSFWEEKYLGVIDGSFTAREVPGHGCCLLRLTRVMEYEETPLIVGSNLHISMGSAEFSSVRSSSGKFEIELTDAGARDGKIFLYYYGSLEVDQTYGCQASLTSAGQGIYILSLSDRTRKEKNAVSLTIKE
jgi:hypothetical protein